MSCSASTRCGRRASRVELAGPVLAAIRSRVPLPGRRRAGGAGERRRADGGGHQLALGLVAAAVRAVLAASLVPTTLAGHPYWTIEDPAERKQQRIHFHKNMALIGGLLFAALDHGHGRDRLSPAAQAALGLRARAAALRGLTGP